MSYSNWQMICAEQLIAMDGILAARWLLGKILVRQLDGKRYSCRIVETEAYHGSHDPASHAFRGHTPRNQPMFAAGGRYYIYFIYGNHFMLNLVTDQPGIPSAVLIRAAAPLEGFYELGSATQLAGPGKLCRALQITRELNNRPIDQEPLTLWQDGYEPAAQKIHCGPRIGIKQGLELKWRFCDSSCAPFLSRPLKLF